MNRPICFRAWHSGRQQWLHSGKPPSGGCHILGETIWAFGEWCRVPLEELNDVVVMQFTGLVDSKGIEIFEGDIYTLDGWTGGPWYCVYHDGEWWNRNVHHTDQAFIDSTKVSREMQHSLATHVRYATVIGNVFENPDLIK